MLGKKKMSEFLRIPKNCCSKLLKKEALNTKKV